VGAGVAQSVEYQTIDWTSGVQTPAEQRIFLLVFMLTAALRPTQPTVQWIPGSFCGDKERPGRDTDHSPACSTEVNSE
jgi:hypothetical protein